MTPLQSAARTYRFALEGLLVSVRSVERRFDMADAQFSCCNDRHRILTSESGLTSVDFTERQRADYEQ